MNIRLNIKRIMCICLSLFAMAMISASVCAASSSIEDAGKTVRLGFFEFGGMFEGAEEGAHKSGYCYEYMMEVATYTGWNYEFVYGSYAELYAMLAKGEIDILPYTNYNEQRAKEVLFSDLVLAEEEYYLAVRSDDSTADPGLLNGKIITTLEGADYNTLLQDWLRENGIEAKIRLDSSLNGTWEAVRQGEADATVFTSNAYSADEFRCMYTFGRKPTYIAVSPNRPDLLTVLNGATTLIATESPALQGELYAKYFLDNPMFRSMTPVEQHYIDQHPVLHVGGFSNNTTDLMISDGKATGLTVDLIDGIIRNLGLNVTTEYKCYNTLDEMQQALVSGEIDVFYPFYPNYSIAQERNLIISKVVRKADMELVYKTGTSYQDALSRIASPTIRLGIFYIRENFPDSQIVPADSVADAVSKVRKGEALGAVAYNQAIRVEKNKYWDLDSVLLLEDCGTCFATIPENHALIMALNRGLNYFTSAEISAMSSRYFINSKVSTVEFLRTHIEFDILLGFVLAALLGLGFSLTRMSRMKKRADEANRTKSTFLFNMSHDIRTPMNAIIGYTDIGLRHVEDVERSTDSYQKILTASHHLLNLINDILEMSRIESGSLELSEGPVDLRQVIEHVDQMSQALAITKSINFETVIGEMKNPYIYADELHGNEVFINLISNAVKYTPMGGKVRFMIDQISDMKDGKALYRFVVSDSGIGMSEEYQTHLFEAFSRERTSTVSKQEGAGLGLFIVKRILDLADGTIHVRSKQNEGSEFTVEIPFRVMEDAAIETFKAALSGNSGNEQIATLEGKKVLLVEDNEMNREIAQDILSETGLNVDTAEDGEIALKKVIDNGVRYYDFILMDIQMPVMNGYEATAEIRKLSGAEKIPIIALSANAFKEDVEQSFASGMNDHLAKPIETKTLLECLKRFL